MDTLKRLFIAVWFVLLLNVTSHAAPKVVTHAEPTPTPARVVTLTEAQVRAAIAANDRLSIELQSKLKTAQDLVTTQAATLKTVQAAQAVTADKNADLNKQVGSLNHTINALKEQIFWDRWKWSLIGVGVGIVVAIVSLFVAKMSGYIAVTAGTVAAKIP